MARLAPHGTIRLVQRFLLGRLARRESRRPAEFLINRIAALDNYFLVEMFRFQEEELPVLA